MDKYDVIVLGAGMSGYNSAVKLTQEGKKVLLVDSYDKAGGNCLHFGCIPSKILLKCSKKYKHIKECFNGVNKKNGIKADDLINISKELNTIKSSIHDDIESMMKINKISYFHAKAKFVNNHTIILDSKREVTADNIIIATGSKIKKLPAKLDKSKNLIYSDKFINITNIPQSVAIIGSGAISLEIAAIMNNFDVQVDIISSKSSFVEYLDQPYVNIIIDELKKNGVGFILDTTITEIEDKKDKSVLYSNQKAIGSYHKIFACIGRISTAEDLGLEAAGVKYSEKGIPVNAKLQTNIDNIYAIGDSREKGYLNFKTAGMASCESDAVVNIINKKPYYFNYFASPFILYSIPYLACVGFNEDQCKKRNINYISEQINLKFNPKFKISGSNVGLIKLIFNAKDQRIIGGSIICDGADELIAIITMSIELNATAEDLSLIQFSHPTISESIKNLAKSALKKLRNN